MNNKLDWITKHNQENNNEYANYVFTGKYLAIQKPNHPKARSDGYVYLHQLQAEKLLGRNLRDEECVHHIDENKYNNCIENLMVFKTKADHTAFHFGCDIILDGDVWVAKIHKNYICPICGKAKDNKAKMCIECYSKEKAKNIPKKDLLFKLLFTYSLTEISRQYNVSYAAVKSWCKKYGLPFKKKDIDNLRLTA